MLKIRKLLRNLDKTSPSKDTWKGRLCLWGGAIAVGLVSVGFSYLADVASSIFSGLRSSHSWLPFILTPLGLAFCVMLTKAYSPVVAGSGIPQAIASIRVKIPKDKVRLLSLRKAIAKIFLTVLSIGCGASVGREGPTVQVGASIMMGAGRIFKYGTRNTLVVAGGAAGISAAFNTPLAGIIFAVEELSRSYVQKTTTLIVSTVVIAGASSLAILGNYTYFGKMQTVIQEPVAIFAMVLCGVFCGISGGFFSRLVLSLSGTGKNKLVQLKRAHPIFFAFSCGILISLLGYFSGGATFGTGYYEARTILEGKDHLPILFSLYKIGALFCSYVSGIPGGIFAPCLAVGAGIGRDISYIFSNVSSQELALLGMVAFLSAVVQSPITAFVIVMEMTADHAILLPLMASSIIASMVSKVFCPTPLYHELSKDFRTPEEGDRSMLNIKQNTKQFFYCIFNGISLTQKLPKTQNEKEGE